MSCQIKEFLIPAGVILFLGMLFGYAINMIALLIATWVSGTPQTMTLKEQVVANAVTGAYMVCFELAAAIVLLAIGFQIEKYLNKNQTE